MQAAQTPQPTIPSPPPAPAAPVIAGGQGSPGTAVGIAPDGSVRITRSSSAREIYEALRHQRSELRNQLERLEEQREDISRQLRESPTLSDTDKKGLEQRIQMLDQRIVDTEKALATADNNVALAAAQPGAIVPPPPPPPESGPPEEFWVLSGIALFVIGLPLTIAYARRLWRRGAGVVTGIPQEVYDRFNKLDQAVDAIAIEVERVGEGQRYLTRVHTEQQRALGAGPAKRVEVAEREKEEQARK